MKAGVSTNNNSREIYSIPIRLFPKYKLVFKVIISIFTLCTFGIIALFLLDKTLVYDRDFKLYCIPVLITFLFFSIDLVHGERLNNQYIKLDNEGIKIKKLLYSRKLKWNEILFVKDTSDYKSNTYIALGKVERNETIKEIRRLLLNGYYILIRLEKYSNIDTYKLISTIEKNMKNNYIKLELL